MAVTYYSIGEYVRSREGLLNKIKAIETLIETMISEMGEAIGNSGTAAYSLDDGQMKIQTQYRSVKDVQAGVEALETQLQMYMNQYRGRKTILRGRLNY